MEWNLIKSFLDKKKARREKMFAELEKEVREEAAEKITIREVVTLGSGVKRTAICFDGSVIYLATDENEDLTKPLIGLRDLYFQMWGPKPLIALR